MCTARWRGGVLAGGLRKKCDKGLEGSGRTWMVPQTLVFGHDDSCFQRNDRNEFGVLFIRDGFGMNRPTSCTVVVRSSNRRCEPKRWGLVEWSESACHEATRLPACIYDREVTPAWLVRTLEGAEIEVERMQRGLDHGV